ncbi:GNAT family N-acetyltransferase [Azospirillum sp. B510]|uniref:GNAT family N-acetyltransferase n=1 Tax=Azospirillum sp. (strain B510) TaxID=137722 RepID=UPI0011D1152E|nr:GNAT family N-acetyltransferase [Azospirillum sp. B510]
MRELSVQPLEPGPLEPTVELSGPEMPVLRFAVLDAGWAPAIAALQDAAIGDRMYPVSDGQIAEMLGPRGLTVGALAGDRLAGFFSLLFPGRGPDSMGIGFGLEGEELDAVAHWTAVIVDPAFRGHRLQRRLVQAVNWRLFPQAPHDYAFVTVRADNPPSLRSMLACGFAMVWAAPKFDGHIRHTLFRITPGDGAVPDGGEMVELMDLPRQMALMARGWIGWPQGADPGRVRFAPPVPGGLVARIRARRR